MHVTRWVVSDDPTIWLAWAQGLTTIVLAGLTGIYVLLTKKTADASAAQARAAAEAVRLAQRQFDSSLLDSYLPVQAAIASAIGLVRAARIMPTVPGSLVPDNFARAVTHAESLGAGLAATMSGIEALLKMAQATKERVRSSSERNSPDAQFFTYHRETFKLETDAVEQLLTALLDELKPTIETLAASTGRTDITMGKLTSVSDTATPSAPSA